MVLRDGKLVQWQYHIRFIEAQAIREMEDLGSDRKSRFEHRSDTSTGHRGRGLGKCTAQSFSQRVPLASLYYQDPASASLALHLAKLGATGFVRHTFRGGLLS